MGIINKEWMDAYHAYVLLKLSGKQATLQSGVNIKTINGNSIVGSGNVDLTTIKFAVARRLPTASSATLNKIYLIPSEDPDKAAHNIKDEYVTLQNEGTPMTAFDNVYFKPSGTPELPSDISVTSAILTLDNGKAKLQVYTGNTLASTSEPDRGTVVYATGENVYYKVIDPSQGQSQTASDWEEVEEAWVQYFWEKIGSTEIDLSNYYTKAQINAMLDGATLEIDASNRLVITKDGSRYFTQLTELTKPNVPTIATTSVSVVTGNATFTASCSTVGATIKYSLDNGSTWSTGTTITVASGFSNLSDNVAKTQTVKLKSVLNGEESDVATITLTINPKVAAGSVSVSRNGNNNDYSTEATVTLTPSASTGATSSYSQDGGSTWTEFSSTVTLTATTSKAANTYQVRAIKSNYTDADVKKSSAFTLNKKKFYYGMGGASLANEAAIKALTGGGTLEQDTMAGTYTVNAASAGQYIWFCGSGTLTGVTSSGFTVPMQAVAVVDGYNCYRSTSAVQQTGNNTFNVA